jgi:hypothetical protein
MLMSLELGPCGPDVDMGPMVHYRLSVGHACTSTQKCNKSGVACMWRVKHDET